MKKVVKNKKVSIDDLAVMVAKGFNSVHTEFDEVKNRLDKVENRLYHVESSLKTTRNEVLNIGDKFVSYHKFDQLSLRVNALEKKSGMKSK